MSLTTSQASQSLDSIAPDFSLRISILLVLLSHCIQQHNLPSQRATRAGLCQPIFARLLEAWERLSAAEAAKAAEEAELFKVKESNFKSEEVTSYS